MRGSLPKSKGPHLAWGAFVLFSAIWAGCGSKPEGTTIDTGSAGGAGATNNETSGSGPIFGAGGQSGSTGTAGASGNGAGGGAGSPASAGGSSSMGPDASVSQCGASIVGLGDCGAQTVAARVRHPNMLIVLDKSGSTTSQPAGFNVSIWEGLKSALSSALDGAKDHVAFGLDLFPAPTDPSKPIPYDCQDTCCQMPNTPDLTVPIADGTVSVPKILDALNATQPGGGTPTAAALARAYAYFTTGPGSTLDGDKYVMLATDGGPNCNPNLDCSTDPSHCTLNLEGSCMPAGTNCCANKSFGEACLDDLATIDQLNKLASAGIKTFVVGIPGSEAYSTYLDKFATAGQETNPNGPPLYYRVDASGGVTGLTKVFTDITTQLVTSCEIPLDTPPKDPGKVNVAINCQVIGSSGTDGTDGWTLDQSSDPEKIVLQGTLCRWVQQQGAQRVDIVFGCPTVH